MVSDAKVCTESTESVSYNVQLVSELLDHIVDAGHVLQHTHALCVWIIPQGEWTLDCLCKFTHSKFGFLKALRNKVNILKGGDEALLFTGDIGLKGQDFSRA